jgi:hypothetical protein
MAHEDGGRGDAAFLATQACRDRMDAHTQPEKVVHPTSCGSLNAHVNVSA